MRSTAVSTRFMSETKRVSSFSCQKTQQQQPPLHSSVYLSSKALQQSDMLGRANENDELGRKLVDQEIRISRLLTENENLRAKTAQMDPNSKEMIQMLEVELQKDRALADERLKEIEKLKTRLVEIEESQSRTLHEREKSHDQKINEVRSKLAEEASSILELELQSRMTQHQESIRRVSNENERLVQELKFYKEKVAELERTHLEFQERSRAGWEKSTKALLEKEANEFERKLAIAEAEIGRFRSIAQEKEKALQEVVLAQALNERKRSEEKEEEGLKWKERMQKALDDQNRTLDLKLQSQYSELQDEHNKSLMAIRAKEQDIKELRQHLSEREFAHTREKEELRKIWEVSLSEKIQSELAVKEKEYIYETSKLKNELEKALLKMESISSEKSRLAQEIKEQERLFEEKRLMAVRQKEEELRWKLNEEISIKIQEYEAKYSKGKQEVEGLNAALIRKDKEIARLEGELGLLEGNLRSIEESSIAKLTEERVRIEASLRSQFDSEMRMKLNESREEVTRIKREKMDLESELDSKTIQLRKAHGSLETCQEKLKEAEESSQWRLESAKRQWEESLRTRVEGEISLRLVESEETIRLEKKENERLTQELQKLGRNMRNQLSEKEEALVSRLREVEMSHLNQVRRREAELRSLFESGLRRELQEFSLKIKDVELENTSVREELESKQKETRELLMMIQILKEENSSFEQRLFQKDSETKELLVQIEEMGRMDWEAKYRAEKATIETQFLMLRQKSEELEANKRILISENELLSKVTKEKQREIESLKRRVIELEAETTRGRRADEVSLAYENKLAEAQTVRELEVNHYRSELARLSEELSYKERETKDLYELLEKRKREEEKRSQLGLSQHPQSKIDGEMQKRGLYERINELEQRLEESEREKEHLRLVYQKNSLELNEKNKELVKKLKELDVLKEQFDEGLSDLGKSRVLVSSETLMRNSLRKQEEKEKLFGDYFS